jgi:hypothetical protein
LGLVRSVRLVVDGLVGVLAGLNTAHELKHQQISKEEIMLNSRIVLSQVRFTKITDEERN